MAARSVQQDKGRGNCCVLSALFVAAQYLAIAGSPQSPGLSRPQHDNLELFVFIFL